MASAIPSGALSKIICRAKSTVPGAVSKVPSENSLGSMISATALQLHPRCTVIVDEPAATHLTEKDYYRWIFANEPEWQAFQ